MKKYIILALAVILVGCGGGGSGGSPKNTPTPTPTDTPTPTPTPPLSSILSFNPDGVSIQPGKPTQTTLTLSAKEPMTITVPIKSANTAVATITRDHCNLSVNIANANPTCNITITGVTSGNTEIIATEPNGKVAIMTINVIGSPGSPNKIVFYTTSSTMPLGTTGSVQLILANPSSDANFNFDITSSNKLITPQTSSCNLSASHTMCNIQISTNSIGKANLIATDPSNSTITATLPVEVVANDGSRNVTFVNKCNSKIWLGIIPASSNGINRGNNNAPTAFCPKGQSQCPFGTTCVTTCSTQACIDAGTSKQCFWNQPNISQTLINNKYALSAGAKTTVTIPRSSYNPQTDIVWDGVFVARQGCDPTNTNPNIPSCAVANCPVDRNMGCLIGTGAKPPATQAELTMLRNGGDFYDVELINGTNIPIAIGPNNRSYPTNIAGQSSYYCAAAGSSITLPSTLSPATIPGGEWQFLPPNASYNLVDGATTTQCSSSSTCSAINSNYVCGYTRANSGFNGPITSQPPTTCGNQLGYLTAFEFCANNPNSNFPPFNCNSLANGSTYTNNDFYQCLSPLKTGYPSGPYNDTSTVCGSTNWSGIANPSTTQYSYSNPTWVSTVLPTITWLKKACPTCYTYPFDDPSSTFVCRNNDTKVANNTNYTVTFCPNNQ